MNWSTTKTAATVALLAAVLLAWQWRQIHTLQCKLAALTAGDSSRHGSRHEMQRPVSLAETLSSTTGVPAQSATAGASQVSGSFVESWRQALLMADPLARSRRISELLGGLTTENAIEVARLFHQQQQAGHSFDQDFELFLRAWGTVAGEQALRDFMSEIREQNPENRAALAANSETLAMLGGWASRNPAATRAWIESLPDGDAKEKFIVGLLDGWALHDFNAAAAYAESRPRSQSRDDFRRLLMERALLAGGIPAAEDWFKRIGDDEHNQLYKQRAFDELTSVMLMRDPTSAARWIADNAGKPWLEGESIRSTAEALAKQSPAEALAWADGLAGVPDAARQRGVATALQQWTAKDANAAGAWLGQQAKRSDYDQLARLFVEGVAALDPESARAWAATIHDEAAQRQAMVAAIRADLSQNGSDAQSRLAAAGVSEELIAAAKEPQDHKALRSLFLDVTGTVPNPHAAIREELAGRLSLRSGELLPDIFIDKGDTHHEIGVKFWSPDSGAPDNVIIRTDWR